MLAKLASRYPNGIGNEDLTYLSDASGRKFGALIFSNDDTEFLIRYNSEFLDKEAMDFLKANDDEYGLDDYDSEDLSDESDID